MEAPDASHLAQQAEHALHRPGSTVKPDLDTSAPASQKSSRRTTTDGVLDRLLHEVDAAMLPRQHSAVEATSAQPSVTGRRSTADTMLQPNQNNDSTGPQLAASNPMQSSSSSNSRRTSASGTAADVLPLPSRVEHTQDASGYRSTADSVLASVLDEVEHEVKGTADQSVDKLLDDVLVGVAGAASQQRTTADSVLDAMLDDMSSGQLEGLSDMRRQPSGQYSVQAGLQAVSRLPCNWMCLHMSMAVRIQNAVPRTTLKPHSVTVAHNSNAPQCGLYAWARVPVCLALCSCCTSIGTLH